MGEPARKLEPSDSGGFRPNIKPNLRIVGGTDWVPPGETNSSFLNAQEGKGDVPKTGSAKEREEQKSNVIKGPWTEKTTPKGQSEKFKNAGAKISFLSQLKRHKKWLGTGGISVGLFSVPVLLLSLLPLKLEMFIQNITNIASAVPGHAVEQRAEYLITRAIATRLLVKAEGGSIDDKLVFCANRSISCSLMATYTTDYFEKEMGVTFEADAHGVAHLGGTATSWDVNINTVDPKMPNYMSPEELMNPAGAIDKKTVTLTSNKEMKKVIKAHVEEHGKHKSRLWRYLARKMLMTKFGVKTWAGPPFVQKIVTKVRDITAEIRSTIIKETIGKIAPRMSVYLTCLQGEVATCLKLREKLGIPAKEVALDPASDPKFKDVNPNSQEYRDAQQKFERSPAQTAATNALDEGTDILVEDILEVGAESGTKGLLSKELLTKLGGPVAIAGMADMVFGAIGAVSTGALSSIWYDISTQAYTNFATYVVTANDKMKAGDLDAESFGVISGMFNEISSTPLAALENGQKVSTSNGRYTAACDQPDGTTKPVTLPKGETVCDDQVMGKDYTSAFETNPALIALKDLAYGWNHSIGYAFDIFNKAIGAVLEIVPGFSQAMGAIGTLATPLINYVMDLAFHTPEVGIDASSSKNYVGLSAGIRASQNAVGEEGVDENGRAMGIGGQFITDQQASVITQEVAQEQQDDFNSQSLLARMFDVNLSGSFIQRFVSQIPTSLTGVAKLPLASLSSIFSGSAVSALSNPATINPFHIPLYGYPANDADLEADPTVYNDASCAASAQARLDSRTYDPSISPVPIYTKSDPCALEKAVVGLGLQAQGITNDPYSLQSLREVSTSAIDVQTQTSGPTGSLKDSSVDIPCATDTTDLGEADGYSKSVKIPIRLCGIPNTHLTSTDNLGQTKAIVNSRASSGWLALINKMRQDLGKDTITVTSSFRSNAAQTYLYDLYQNHGGNVAAPPGTSNHQLGTAFDFKLDNNKNNSDSCVTINGICTPPIDDPVYNWLVKNASSYSISQYSGEYWHWEMKDK